MFTALETCVSVLVLVLVLAQLTRAVTFAAPQATCITLVHQLFPRRLRGLGRALYKSLGCRLLNVLGGGGWIAFAL